MNKQLQNLQNVNSYSSPGNRLNGWMMTMYSSGFPKREFIHERFLISIHTRAKTTYFDLIRILCLVLNVRVLRDDYLGGLYIVGRKHAVTMMKDWLTRVVKEIEEEVEEERDYESSRRKGYQAAKEKNIAFNTYVSRYRKKLIKDLYKEVESILSLKKDFYLDKYAAIRKVRQNELYDQTFFAEYIRENRLTHLKQFKCTIN